MSKAPPNATNSPKEIPARGLVAGLRHPRSCYLAAAVLLIPSLCGCGSSGPTLHTAAVERVIAESILTEHNLHTTVVCPSNVPQRAGIAFTCRAALQVGSYPVAVTETNGSGRVRYQNEQPLAILNIAAVERGIAQSILSQRHLHATVTCPREVLQRAGIFFTCTATINGQGHPFGVTELDNNGHVRYVGGQ
jgi:hypothetical protein